MKKLLLLLFSLFVTEQFAQTGMQIVYTHTNCPITNDSITWVEIDSNNVKWVGTRNGLYSFDNINWTRFDVSNSNIPSNKIDKFRIAKDNTIWFVNHDKGFYKFSNNTFTLYNKTNLPALTTDSLGGLTIDGLDLFFWTKHHGVIRYNTVTSAISTLDLSNSCLTNVVKLVLHNNHKIYGLCPNPTTIINNMPQTMADSIVSVYNFAFTNNSNLSVNEYCFKTGPSYGTYIDVFTDKFYHRFEVFDTLISTGNLQKYIRVFDKNNWRANYQSFNQPMPKQMFLSPLVFCQLLISNAVAYINHIPVVGGGAIHYFPSMPPSTAANFDTDMYNNIWIATDKGLVAYNDSALFLGKIEITKNDFLIYPNPAHSQLILKGIANVSQVSILNSLGEFIESKNVQEGKIDINGLLPGIYFVGVLEETGRCKYYKFSKQ